MQDKSYVRAHLRMDVMILLHYRKLTPQEYATLEHQSNTNNTDDVPSLHSFSLAPFLEGKEKEEKEGTIDPFIINALLDINVKLNLIISILAGENKTDILNRKPVEANLSEGGIGFTTSEKMEEGTLLEIKMVLPVFPIALIKVWGRVVRTEPLSAGGYRTGIQYIQIREEDQNKIVHYLFKKQREDLRRQKGGKE